ncbi:MAG: hypothetical protein JZU65_00670 [Chlorobium sp.]|jgi:hypothetical protein|nr:hypothetical protein [Chlorobium sp.]
MKYSPQIAWRTLAAGVFQLTRETVDDPATYRVSVAVVDSNNVGSGQKEIGFWTVDYWGVPYLIIATASGYVDVQDYFRVGRCPTSGQMAIIYKSVYDGRALALSPENFQHLHPMALANSHKYDMAVLWANNPNAKKVPFTSSTTPTIANYQDDQTDPEDALKTINYASDFGETPLIRCIIVTSSTVEYQLQQMPQFTKVDDLIDSIFFDIGDALTGYLIISKS